ncbi:MAG: SpoIVB peptidase [Clostridia bacterium]|nr:SpoIVB peptidase [Clostridia bacterium]
MMKQIGMKALCFILIIYSLLATPLTAFAVESGVENVLSSGEESVGVLADGVQIGSRLWELFFGEDEDRSEVSLLPGGSVFGVKIKQKYVTVTDARGIPALKNGDIILSVDGESVKNASDVKRMVQKSRGNSLTIRALHQGSEIAVEIRPSFENGEYRLGIALRDGAAGLGTVTFVDPKTGVFGGLGHGICDADSGEVIAMDSGEVCGVILGGIHKGESGKPGELCGVLTERDLGDITVNSECGVFGIITDIPSGLGQPISIARRDEVCEGEATIISTLKNGMTAEYSIEIYDIDMSSEGSKSFRVRVTDETLKALTGGIVRGMSGSPIIQNGKLVGAITHVLVAEPTEGYGIFIENMLNASQMPIQKAA